MKKNGATFIHLATGLLVGYPPCPNVEYFTRFIKEKYGIPVVVGTHPIPENYLITHEACRTWEGPQWASTLAPTMANRNTRLAYD